MAQGVSGSTLSNLAASRARIDKTRQLLNLGERGVSQPQVAPPARAPADPRGPQGAPAVDLPDVPPEVRERMLEQIQGFSEQIQTGQETPLPSSDPQLIPPPTPEETPLLTEEIRRLRSEKESPSTQFSRLAGRPGSPREVAMLQTRLMLENQLGRPPTAIEIRTAISSSEFISPSFPVAFESKPR